MMGDASDRVTNRNDLMGLALAEQAGGTKALRVRVRELEAEVATLRAEQASQSRHCPECVSAQATIARVKAAAGPVLHMAEAYHRRRFDMVCDHEPGDCQCDAEAQSIAALGAIRAALTPPEET